MTGISNYKIREVDQHEIQLLIDISRNTFIEAFGSRNKPEDMEIYVSRAFSPEQVTKEFNHPESTFYFVYVEDYVIGYLKINTGSAQSELLPEESVEVERIYVITEYQGKRIGAILMNQAVQVARRLNKAVVWLGVWEKNIEAIKFYERHGFEKFDTHNFMLGNDEQTDSLMKRKVN